MSIFRHIGNQPFIFATGLAALVHSTWSLGTLFAGNEPMPQFSFAWFAWVIPAFLIAFALDVGQIATSAEIRAGNHTRTKYATFVIFAAATYYLQWLYMAHHMPLVSMGEGVREQWSGFAQLIRDASIWIIPAFMPMSTLFYTFSSEHDATPIQQSVQVERVEPVVPVVTMGNAPLLTGDNEVGVIPVQNIETSGLFTVACPDCDWTGEYDNQKSAKFGLRTHQARYCTKVPVLNGHSHEDQ